MLMGASPTPRNIYELYLELGRIGECWQFAISASTKAPSPTLSP
jgi:hypothetical protein